MLRASGSVRVDAPPERVFAFLDDPHNHRDVTPGLVEVRNVEPLAAGGKRLEHTYRMAGVDVDGALVQTEHDPPSRHAFALRGTLTGEITIDVEPDGDGSVVTYAAAYDLPDSVLARVAEPVVRRFNERQIRRTLANVRSALESGEE